MSSRFPLVLAAGVLLAACSAAGGVQEDSSLDVAPSATSVVAGEGTVTLTATVSGDVNVVSWTLAGPGSISPSQGLTTVYTPPTRVDADAAVTVTARMNELSRAVAITVHPAPPAPVVGRVLRVSGQPVENATVHVPPDLFATTDAAGTFTIPGVRVPYEIQVLAPGNFLLVVQDLRRRDPTLLIDVGGVESPLHTGMTSGQVSGGAGFPPPAGYRTAVAVATPAFDEWAVRQGGVEAWGLGWADAVGAYGAQTPLTSAEADGTLQALQWRTDAGGWPVEYVASGVRGTHLVSGAIVDGQHLTLATTPDATASIAGHLGFGGPSGYLRAIARVGGARIPIVPDLVAPSGPFALATPRGADAVELTMSTTSPGALVFSSYNLGAFRRVAPDATAADLTLVAPPNPWLPPDGATLSAEEDPVFQWQVMGAPSPVYVASFDRNDLFSPLSLRLITTASTVVIPDLSALGVTVPRGELFTWFVYGTTAASTTDEACGPEGYLVRTDDFVWGRSVHFAFRTPP